MHPQSRLPVVPLLPLWRFLLLHPSLQRTTPTSIRGRNTRPHFVALGAVHPRLWRCHQCSLCCLGTATGCSVNISRWQWRPTAPAAAAAAAAAAATAAAAAGRLREIRGMRKPQAPCERYTRCLCHCCNHLRRSSRNSSSSSGRRLSCPLNFNFSSHNIRLQRRALSNFNFLWW